MEKQIRIYGMNDNPTDEEMKKMIQDFLTQKDDMEAPPVQTKAKNESIA